MPLPADSPAVRGRAGLTAELAARMPEVVRADDAVRALYASDGSNHRVLPVGVAFPRRDEDVAQLVEWCGAEGVPITSRGAGTNCAGNAVGPGLVIDFSKHFNASSEPDLDARSIVVQPGAVLDHVQRKLAPARLRIGPDPSSHNRCTIGGMIGTNACGSHSVAWGTTTDAVQDLEILRADGSQFWLSDAPSSLTAELARLAGAYAPAIESGLGRFPRQISGYGLQHLLGPSPSLAKAYVGSEGTLGIITRARVGLVELPEATRLVLAAFADNIAAAAAAPAIAAAQPLTCESISQGVVDAFDSRRTPEGRPELPPGGAWLLVDVGGASDEVDERAAAMAAVCRAAGATNVEVVRDPKAARALWSIRERGAGLATRTAEGREAWPGWEDAAVPVEHLSGYVADFEELLAEHGRTGVLYGHFGEGCVHVRIDHDLVTEAGRAAYRRFTEDACDLVIAHSGVPSGEHGDGRARSELLSRVYGPELTAAFAAYKGIWDPERLFNPGMITDPAALDADLRVALSRPHRENLAFIYPDDNFDFGQAMRRCVGVGACRKTSGGGMCPSYRATGDEENSTRGRARLLFEMLDGHLAAQSWDSPEVAEALDLCLSCKACASECPVGVDMATYKAEFLHQHYQGKRRPASHFTMGRLPELLRLARRAPRVARRLMGLANRGLGWPGVGRWGAKLAGVDPRRPLPVIAETLPQLAAGAEPGEGLPAILWLDTFTTNFAPGAVDDAVRLLRAAGFAVTPAGLDECCGLTLISTGQLDRAKLTLRRSIELLDRTEGPIVVLEPSCAAALRHDAGQLLGGDPATGRAADRVAARVRTLAEILEPADLPLAPLPADQRELVVQFHCHQRSVLGTDADRRLLARIGAEVTSVDEGCCGLAGNFGYEAGHWEVSLACAEDALLPALRAHPEATVLADGLSCRLQCDHVGGRSATHLASVLAQQLTD